MNKKRTIIIVSIVSTLLLLTLGGFTYAYFTGVISGTGKMNTITIGSLNVEFSESANINVTLGKPILDSNVLTQGYKNTFTLGHKANAKLDSCYKLSLVIDNIQSKFAVNSLKWEIVEGSTVITSGHFSGAASGDQIVLLEESLSKNVTKTYSLIIWLSYSSTEDQSNLLIGNSGVSLTAHVKVENQSSNDSNKCLPPIKRSGTLANKIITDNNGGKSDASVNFGTVSSDSGDLGLYYTAGSNLSYTEGGKVSYYYRGAVQNNFVKFGKNSSNQDLYWRIIRIDEDGNIRLIYNGITTAQKGTTTQIGTSAFNSSYNQNAYVGYMYGTPGSTTYEAEHANTNNSTIKTTIDNWFVANMTEERSYLSEDAVYCNNRKLGQWDGKPNTGYGTQGTGYAEFNIHLIPSGSNFNPSPRPDYRCPQVNDQFTTTTATKGNKKLTYPVGLITGSEVAFAGGKGGSDNSNYYLNTAQNYWTLSPSYFSGGRSHLFIMSSNGSIGGSDVDNGLGVRPTVSLKSNSEVLRGTGTPEQPYELK